MNTPRFCHSPEFRRPWFSALCMLVALLLLALPTQAKIISFNLRGTAGFGLLPGNVSTSMTGGTGGEIGAGITYDDVTLLLTVTNVGWGSSQGFIDLTSLSSVAHIHGPTTNNNGNGFTQTAGTVVTLTRSSTAITGGTFTNAPITLTSLQQTDLLNGKYYINIHTNNNTGGEMRGFLVPVPLSTTTAASSVTSTGAVINGTVNAYGNSTAVSFDYGLTSSYGTNVAGTPSPLTTSTDTAVSATLTGLAPNTTYHFRVNGASLAGTANGSNLTFTTLGVPDIAVEQPVGTGLTDAVSSIAFGSVLNGATSTPKTFKITNTGTATLTLGTITKDGANNGEFTVGTPGSSSLAPGISTTFDVTFSPGASGARSAAIHIPSNVSGAKNPFDIALTGTGLTPIENWRKTWFSTTDNDGNAADLFDFDKDGLVNLIEFAFGLNPTLSSSGQLPEAQLIAGNYVISFTQPAGVSGITYGAEKNTMLGALGWEAITDTDPSPTGYTFSVPVSGNPQLFLRLKVTRP